MKLFEMGHSLEEIDNLSFDDIGLLIGYFAGKRMGEEALSTTAEHLRGGD